jgi:hypothetical protein
MANHYQLLVETKANLFNRPVPARVASLDAGSSGLGLAANGGLIYLEREQNIR